LIHQATTDTGEVAGGVGGNAPPRSAGAVSRGKRRNTGDFVFKYFTFFFALAVFSLVFVMAYEMYLGSRETISKFGLSFIARSVWDPVNDEFGAAPFIFGTLLSSFIALLIAVPLGLGVAVFLSELAPRWIDRPISFLVELLAAIPSILYGLWGIFVLIPFLRTTVEPFLGKNLGFLPFFTGPPYGFGMLAAGVVLSIMILPIVASISRDVLKSVPVSYREAALALGGTRWETSRIVLSSGRSGIVGAALLGLGRAVGETMAVTMVIGNRAEISASLFDPGYSMASVLANEFAEAIGSLHVSALVEIALLLFLVTVVLNALARLIVWTATRRFSNA
jgi:phosphate transport system permease protein